MQEQDKQAASAWLLELSGLTSGCEWLRILVRAGGFAPKLFSNPRYGGKSSRLHGAWKKVAPIGKPPGAEGEDPKMSANALGPAVAMQLCRRRSFPANCR